jgi:hypothetical protein
LSKIGYNITYIIGNEKMKKFTGDLSKDIAEIEQLKSESLTALSLYNHLLHFYQEEGDKGLEYIRKMWNIAKEENAKLRRN